MITIGGTNAANVGFATGHTFFQPTAPAPSSSSASSSAGTGGSGKFFKLVCEHVFEHVEIIHEYGGEQLKHQLFAQLGARPADQQHRRNAAVQQRHKRQHRQLICLID